MAIAPIQAPHGRYIERSFIFPQSASVEPMRLLNLVTDDLFRSVD